MTSYVELRKNRTPVEYITCPVKYDSWGDPYVKVSFWQELHSYGFIGNYALQEHGSAGYDVQWKLVSGPEVRFPSNRTSRGWK
jgi:hypothetical protein